MEAEFVRDGMAARRHAEGYVAVRFVPGGRVTARAVLELNEWVLEQRRGEPRLPLLVDVRDLGRVDADVLPAAVRHYFENARGRSGTPRVAFVSPYALPRIVVSFLALSRAPARTFATTEDAVKWLLWARAAPRQASRAGGA